MTIPANEMMKYLEQLLSGQELKVNKGLAHVTFEALNQTQLKELRDKLVKELGQ